MLTMIMGDETLSENLQGLKQFDYFENYAIDMLIPTVATILRPGASRARTQDLGTLSLEREPDESDGAYQDRRNENAKKLTANFEASRTEIYQPLLIEMVQTWVRNAQLSQLQLATVVTNFDQVVGKGRWIQIIGAVGGAQ